MTLSGQRIGVTAGPTRAWLDPVRYIANASTGELGLRIAEGLADAGARVDLVLGPGIPPPNRDGIAVHPIETVDDLEKRLSELAENPEGEPFSCWIHSMAVLDYVPIQPSSTKIDSEADRLDLSLKRTPKIIRGFQEWFPRALLVGFKLETTEDPHLLRDSASKLADRHGCDLVVANAAPFRDPANHQAYLFNRSPEEWSGPFTGKEAIARAVIHWLESRIPVHVSS